MIALALLLAATEARVAIVIGANGAAPGKRELHFAHRDASAVAETLIATARFSPSDVHLLLDPKPEQVLSMIEGLNVPEHAILFFYYSGHADERAVYPHGEALSLADVRARLSQSRAAVKIGVLDACRGGGWTGSKGFSTEGPFEIETPLNVASEGTVYIASSTGSESAHESARLRGSFFTHHFVAGLRGAADTSGEGDVSIGEAFAYAQRRTVRDTAATTDEPQHPSFAINLRGRQDLVLAAPASSPSSVELEEKEGPLEIIHLDSGETVAEIDAGSRLLRLAITPGRYLLRRRTPGGTFAVELDVTRGQPQRISEMDLRRVDAVVLTTKDNSDLSRNDARLLSHSTSTPPASLVRFKVGLGIAPNLSAQPIVQQTTQIVATPLDVWPGAYIGFNAALGITDRLSWNVGTGSFAYRLFEHGRFELIPYGGLTGIAFNPTYLNMSVGGGVDARVWLAPNVSLIPGVRASANYQVAGAHVSLFTPSFSTSVSGLWQLGAQAIVSAQIGDKLTVNAGVLYGQNLHRGPLALTLAVGSVGSLGLQPLPLLQWHLTPVISLDAYLSVQFLLTDPAGRNTITPGVANVSGIGGMTFHF